MKPVWRVELLGGLRAARGERVVTRFDTRKAAALLAWLALHPDRLHAREALAEQFWPDEDPEATRNRFKQVLSLVRRELEPAGTEPGSVLETDRTHIRVRPGALTSDVAEFESALAQARTGEGKARREALERAVELYRGELAPGFYEEFIVAERHRLAEAYLDALERLAQGLAEEGEPARALDCYRRALAVDPLRESAHLGMIQLYAAGGRTADALRQYAELERVLKEALEAAPSPAVRALVEQLRRQEGPGRPDPVWSLAATVTQTAMPLPAPPRTEVQDREPAPARPAAELPLPLTRFFGREAEMARLARLLHPDGSRLVTLMGPAGAGKSRLAIEAARAALESFGGGAWFIPLAAKDDALSLREAIAAALGLPASDEINPLERAAAYLNARGGEGGAPSLLVLDNLEHLLPAGAVEAILALLQQAPRVTLLVTSRQRLDVEGERVFPVLPLSTPVQELGTGDLRGFSSVQLFVDRAQAAEPEFELTEGNAGAIAKLCRRLEGIPLALELAAAWAAELSPDQMVERLTRRFDLLVSRRRDLESRHQSLRGALEWSCRQLDPHLLRFHAGLSIFRGGAALEAAEAVAGRFAGESGLSTLECLSELRARSLLVAEPGEQGVRYRQLETLREHAAELLSEAEREQLGLLHAAWALELAEAGARALDGPDQAAWLIRLEAEHDNLRAALQGCAQRGDSRTLAALAAALVEFWERRGYFQEGREWLEGVPAGELSPSDRAAVLRGGAVMHWYQRDAGPARRCLEEALRLYEAAGETREAAITQTRLGNVALLEGALDEAETHCRAALDAFRRLGEHAKAAWTLRSLGEIAAQQGELTAAMALFQQSLALCRERGELRGIAGSLTYIGGVARAQGNVEVSRSATEEALAIHEQLGDRSARSSSLDCLACLAAGERAWAEAHDLAMEAVALHRELGQPLAVAWVLEELARTLADQGRLHRAALLWGAALRADTVHAPRTEERLLADPEVELTRAMLGEEPFVQAFSQGRELGAERTLARVLLDGA